MVCSDGSIFYHHAESGGSRHDHPLDSTWHEELANERARLGLRRESDDSVAEGFVEPELEVELQTFEVQLPADAAVSGDSLMGDVEDPDFVVRTRTFEVRLA